MYIPCLILGKWQVCFIVSIAKGEINMHDIPGSCSETVMYLMPNVVNVSKN